MLTDENHQDIGEIVRINIRHKMKEKDLTYLALARAYGGSVGSIQKLLSGQRSPGVKLLDKISKALDCSISELVTPMTSARNKDLADEIVKRLREEKEEERFKTLTISSVDEVIKIVDSLGGWDNAFDVLKLQLEKQKSAGAKLDNYRDYLKRNYQEQFIESKQVSQQWNN